LRVGQAEVGLDRHGEDADDLPVDEVEGVDQHQHRQHQHAIARRLRPASVTALFVLHRREGITA